MSKKANLTFSKPVPPFLAKIKADLGYKEPTLADKIAPEGATVADDIKDEDIDQYRKKKQYDIANATIVETTEDLAPKKNNSSSQDNVTNQQDKPSVDIKSFKPTFRAIDKKERTQAIVQSNLKKNTVPPPKSSSFKMSSETYEQFQERVQHQKQKILHEKTKKIFKSNKNLLSFDD